LFRGSLAVDILDEAGDVVAHVTRTLYIRRKQAPFEETKRRP